ncbi:hypothetical protein [Alteromonas stellipolaris]|uniref:hypothetical protein n=1 Tax=Alteromonas stellipolaris TaxID=233316 RepID=UPI0026E38FA6|nr:hypothetical protein [Alteromonas stellipolaris]MDO6535567.1 hypothetical protein [Alteromonas stellipolaris]MDO6627443.1 hypothetical protein [Alteromonas stellipolaris]
MRKLILHIGLHKTGTSAIQKHLISVEDKLSEMGWSLFRIRKDGSLSNVGNINTWVDFTGLGDEFSASIDDGMYDALASTQGNIIASCEELSWLNPNQILDMKTRLVEIFTDIKIICYVRRQDEHFISHYKQGFRYPHSSARMFYSFTNPLNPLWENYYRKYLDYFAKAEAWASVFGESNVIFKEFNREKLHDRNSALDFLKTLKLNVEGSHQSNKKSGVNEALSLHQCIVNDAIFEARSELWYELGGQSFSKSLLWNNEGSETNNPLEGFKIEIIKQFSQSNINLKKYIPDLSDDWVVDSEPEAHVDMGPKNTEKNIELYRESLVLLITYFDELSLYQFLKFKIRKFKNRYIAEIRKR